MRPLLVVIFFALLPVSAHAREYHVSAAKGGDSNDGSARSPLKTISAAARLAQPGDTITVHEGTYRERITPPRGGESDSRRIVYQAAEGETAVIKGSEVIRDWKPYQGEVWKAAIPNAFFGSYNPYKDLITGDWFNGKRRPHHTGEVYLNGKSLFEAEVLDGVINPRPYPSARDKEASTWTWYTESDKDFTYIYANFHGRNPNRELVEINVRESCFYPRETGRNYITIRGFRMAHAATQWAAPTAEQIGLIGTNWSKGWIIENNVISDSKCSGITLGKDRKTGHNVWINDPIKDGAIHYNEVIIRALDEGWSKQTIGSHVVRNNTIFNCEQTGIAGSLGAVFSTITNNHIYNIWTKRQFEGAELAGIKLHAAIDVLIKDNWIHNAGRGLWMDWMAQGTRISSNLLYDNTLEDLFVEVDHGPFLVDNNLFLSPVSLRDVSEGGAYVHNLLTGRIHASRELSRFTPYHKAHSTALMGLGNIRGGDDRFYNNIFAGGADSGAPPSSDETRFQSFAGYGLWVYDTREMPLQTAGNVYLNGARAYAREVAPLTVADGNPNPKITETPTTAFIELDLTPELGKAATVRVTTDLLGKAHIPGLGYENPDGTPLVIDTDFLGRKRSPSEPTPGPFENPGQGVIKLKLR